VAKVAFLFYATAFGVLAAALAVVWLMTEALGLVGQFEDFMSGIGFRGFRIMSPLVVLGVLLVFGALAVFLTLLTLFAAALYNLSARHGGAVRFTVSPHIAAAPPTSDADDAVSPATSAVRTPIVQWRSLTSTPS